jgi:hypothetical protein
MSFRISGRKTGSHLSGKCSTVRRRSRCSDALPDISMRSADACTDDNADESAVPKYKLFQAGNIPEGKSNRG